MAELHPEIDKLRGYLDGLSPQARAMVAAELERQALSGTGGGDAVLQALRASLRAEPSAAPQPERGDAAQRLFFQPIEPFLVDEPLPATSRGRIQRTSLPRIWTWLTRDLVPAESAAYGEAVTAAVRQGGEPAAVHLARGFQDAVVARAAPLLERAGRDEAAGRRLSAQLGSPREVADLRDTLAILRARDALAAAAARMPPVIKNLASESLENARLMLGAPAVRPLEVFPYALVLLLGRLAQPWQLIRLATKAADTDDAAKVAQTSFAAAVDLALTELDRRVFTLKAALRQRQAASLAPLLKDIHDFVRGVRTELDLPGHAGWSRRLADLRKDVAASLSAEIAAAMADIRHLLRPPRGQPNALPDLAAAGYGIELLVQCRTFAAELALNEVTQRAWAELTRLLDSRISALIEALRAAAPAEKPRIRAQLDPLIQYAGPVLGAAYAQLLIKAVDVAAAQGAAAAGASRALD